MPRTLVRWAPIVAVELGVENGLHFLDAPEPSTAAFDAQVLIERRSVKSFDDAVGLWALDLGGAVLDRFELEEQLVRMPVGAATELPAIV